jgi:sugar phosphate isomerase/epimerase
MRFGIGSYTYTWAIGVPGYPTPPTPMDAFRLLDKAVALGLSVVQYCDNLPLTDLSERDRARLSAQARLSGVAVEVGTRGIDAENLRRHLRLAQQFGSPFVRVVIDQGEDEPTADEAIQRLRPMVAEYAAARIKLALENHDRFRSEQLAAMVEVLGREHVGICLDTVNSFGSLEGPDVVIPTLAPYTVNLHIKDFQIRRADHKMGFVIEGTPAGQGRLNVPQTLAQLPHCQSAILELWTPYQGNMEDTISLEAQWADASISYLKAL